MDELERLTAAIVRDLGSRLASFVAPNEAGDPSELLEGLDGVAEALEKADPPERLGEMIALADALAVDLPDELADELELEGDDDDDDDESEGA
jgi:hypothetical protein